MSDTIETNNINNLVGKKHLVKRYIFFVLAVFLLAATYNLFILPHNLIFGGISGIAVVTKNWIDPSILIFATNILLLILGFIILGKEKIKGSIVGIFLYPLFVKMTADIGQYIVLEHTDILLNVLFAGFLSGIASGAILKIGLSTGGSDIAAQILSKMFKISIGKGYIIIDGAIVLFGGVFLGIIKVMYALVLLYVYSLMADKVMLGISDNKAFYIITEKEEEVKKYVLDSLNHGVTVLKARGGYDNQKQDVLLCVVPANHYFKLKEGISLIDKDAFFVVTDAYEVKGGA